MKKLFIGLLALGTILAFGLASASSTDISKDTCHYLAVRSSVVDFSPNYNSRISIAYDLNSAMGAEFISMDLIQLLDKLERLC